MVKPIIPIWEAKKKKKKKKKKTEFFEKILSKLGKPLNDGIVNI